MKKNIVNRYFLIFNLIFLISFLNVNADDNTTTNSVKNDRHKLDGFAIGIGYSIISLGEDATLFDTLTGPSIYITQINANGFGWNFGITYILSTSFYDYKALSGDASLTYGFRGSPNTIIQLKSGIIGYYGGNSDGGEGGDVALSPGVGLIQRLNNKFAINGELASRFWLANDKGTAMGAKIGILIKL